MLVFNLSMFKICLCSPGIQYSVIKSSKFELNPTQKPVTKNRTPRCCIQVDTVNTFRARAIEDDKNTGWQKLYTLINLECRKRDYKSKSHYFCKNLDEFLHTYVPYIICRFALRVMRKEIEILHGALWQFFALMSFGLWCFTCFAKYFRL